LAVHASKVLFGSPSVRFSSPPPPPPLLKFIWLANFGPRPQVAKLNASFGWSRRPGNANLSSCGHDHSVQQGMSDDVSDDVGLDY
jgi:hypothetical protein